MARLPFSLLFNLLLDNVRKPDEAKYKLIEISEATSLSTNQLSMYKRRLHDNPTIENALTLLDFFDMPSAFLDCESELEAMEMIHAVHHLSEIEDTGDIRLRDAQEVDLSEEALRQVREIVSWVFARERALEQGKPVPSLPEFTDS